MRHITRYSPTTRQFYLGEQTELPADAYVVTPEQVEEIIRQNAVTPDYTEIDGLRRAAYAEEVDPLVFEATIKRELGDEAEAGRLMQAAIEARNAIQTRYPKPAI